jgi:hypothetical protein
LSSFKPKISFAALAKADATNPPTDAQEAAATLAGYSSIDHDLLQNAQIFRFGIIVSQ